MPPQLPALTLHDASARVIDVRTQYPDGLLGVPRSGLRLSWRAAADTAQVAYQIRWGSQVSAVTPPIASDASIGIMAPGPDLGPGERRRYAVRFATAQGWSRWSDDVVVEAAVDLSALDAVPIGGSEPTEGPVMLLRRSFTLPAAPLSARLRATFWGVGELRINGRRATDEHLAPGWTNYRKRLVLGTWDVTDLLESGENAIAVLLGDGWYRGRLGWENGTEQYGAELAALVQLEVECLDGTRVRVATSTEWVTSTGAIRSASLYDGVEVDLQQDPTGWDAPGFDDSTWTAAEEVAVNMGAVEPRITTGVRTVGEWAATRKARGAHTLIDTGQNIAGWLRLVVEGKAGARVTVRHAEVLESDGSIHTASLRTARATDSYILAHDGFTTLEPTFTFHGFQFAEVTGAAVVSATAVAVSSADLPRSTFSAADPRLEQLHSNVAWSQRDNFVSLPTDCPQRDERLGWTGDAQAFAATASTLFDVESFWMSWLRDVELDQDADGSVASVVPNILNEPDPSTVGEWTTMGRAGWGDVATIAPWAVYESYGSDEVLIRQLDSMRRWVQSLEQRSVGGLLPTEFQFGDWLDPDAPAGEPWKAKVSADYVANAFFAHSARLLADAERLVGDSGNAERAAQISERVARATWNRWGSQAAETGTGAAIALEFQIAPESARTRIGDRLARNVRRERGRITTGFLGTPLILHALAHSNHFDEAYLMLLRLEPPSWLYQVTMGATSVWERWDALAPDGSINSGALATEGSPSMLSFNHYAYGAVVDWMYRYVAGIAPTRDRPGYRRILVAPRPSTEIPWAAASISTRLGPASIDWRVTGSHMDISLLVPFGADATMDLPVTGRSIVELDGRPFSGGSVGPGQHRIAVSWPRIADPSVSAGASSR
ncbi:alpha-L-rhamnosidase [Microbacterium natoriense]|uniref:alpha-L-rhamnosidase n=1 Tax=Microbacterium natoriense TaxID=284570 RepID=A0AAW8ERS3_9MICO|nr:alpha-L-rhamnosidase [Microbacterium natoriense]